MQTKGTTLRAVQSHLLRRRARLLHMGDHVLSKEDSYRICDSYRLMLTMIGDIVEVLRTELSDEEWQSFRRNYSAAALARKLEELCSLDVAYVNKQFKNMTQCLRHISDKDMPIFGERYLHRRRFNAVIAEMARSWDVATDGVIWSIIQPFWSLFIRNDSQKHFQFLNDILQFNCRVTLRDIDWIEEENIQAYVDFEEKLHTQTYDEAVLRELGDIVYDWLKDFSFDNPWADHGYGATFEVRRSEGTTAKFHAMEPTVESVQLSRDLNWTPSEFCWPGITQSYKWYEESMLENAAQGRDAREGLTSASDLTCKVQLVPKGIDKKRLVSMEPTVHQFYQKQIGSLFDAHFRKHPEMRIDLHDQSKNCRLTLRGSQNRIYGTVDLSSASDSNTVKIVKAALRKLPRLLSAVLRCRTTKAVLPDGRVVALEKFSPMGSAVCFPLECIVFSAVVALANRRLGIDTYYRIYGDDMVISVEVWDEVLKILNGLNFIVNLDKSFHPDLPFKESCGLEAYRGFDVTPMRLSRKWDSYEMLRDSLSLKNKERWINQIHSLKLRKKTASTKREKKYLSNRMMHLRDRIRDVRISQQLDSMYKLANEAYFREYYSLRKLIISRARRYYRFPIFSNIEGIGFLTYNTNIIDNYNTRVVNGELCVHVMKTCSSIDPGSQIARYSKLLEEYDRTNRQTLMTPYDVMDVAAGTGHTIVKMVWLPLVSLLEGQYAPDAQSEDAYLDILYRLYSSDH